MNIPSFQELQQMPLVELRDWHNTCLKLEESKTDPLLIERLGQARRVYKRRKSEQEDAKKKVKLWDPTTNTKLTYKEMEEKFGEILTTTCFDCGGKYSKKLIAALHRVVPAKEVDVKINKRPNPKHTIREPFIGVSKMMLKDTSILKMNANKTMLYFMLRANVWDWSGAADSMDIFGRFYVDRQLLAASFTHELLAGFFGVKRLSIVRWLKQLEEEGALISYKQYDKETKQFKPNVYVMGYVDEEGYDVYLLDNHHIPEVKQTILDKLNRPLIQK